MALYIHLQLDRDRMSWENSSLYDERPCGVLYSLRLVNYILQKFPQKLHCLKFSVWSNCIFSFCHNWSNCSATSSELLNWDTNFNHTSFYKMSSCYTLKLSSLFQLRQHLGIHLNRFWVAYISLGDKSQMWHQKLKCVITSSTHILGCDMSKSNINTCLLFFFSFTANIQFHLKEYKFDWGKKRQRIKSQRKRERRKRDD